MKRSMRQNARDAIALNSPPRLAEDKASQLAQGQVFIFKEARGYANDRETRGKGLAAQRSHTEGSRHSSDWLRRAGERVCRADQDRYPQPSRCGYRLNA